MAAEGKQATQITPIGKLAVIDERGEVEGEELTRRISRLAGGLFQLGVGPGTGLGIMCRNHRMFIEASRAALTAGADIYYLSTEYSAPDLSRIVQMNDIRVLIYDGEFSELTRDLAVEHSLVAWPCGNIQSSIDDLISRNHEEPNNIPLGRQILLTSGTEGLPKVAPRSALSSPKGVAAFLERIPIRPGGSTLCAAPLYHAWGHLHLRLALALKAQKFILPLTSDPSVILQAIADHNPDTIVATPTILLAVTTAAHRNQRSVPESALRALRVIVITGSAMPPGLVERTTDVFGHTLYCLYGSTEAGWISAATPDDLSDDTRTAGRPFETVTVRISDAHGQACAAGTVGRICIESDNAAAGPGVSADTLVETGDLGYLDHDGRLFVVGRADEMLLVGGENLYPAEIERVLDSHPDVAESAVVGRPDPHYGEVPVAFVVLADKSAATDRAELSRWLRGRMAYSKVPREIIFLERLPRNAAGKILKQTLEESLCGDSSGPGNSDKPSSTASRM